MKKVLSFFAFCVVISAQAQIPNMACKTNETTKNVQIIGSGSYAMFGDLQKTYNNMNANTTLWAEGVVEMSGNTGNDKLVECHSYKNVDFPSISISDEQKKRWYSGMPFEITLTFANPTDQILDLKYQFGTISGFEYLSIDAYQVRQIQITVQPDDSEQLMLKVLNENYPALDNDVLVYVSRNISPNE